MDKRTVSLVLGAGGARGYAHIGVIRWLNDHGFDIRSIAGSSMGALVGGIYAAGQLDTYTEWVRALERRNVIRLLDLSFGNSGLFKGERIIQTLRDLIGEYNIEDLPISFTAVATDLDAEKEVWLSKGPLFDAVRASIAIPTVLTPFDFNGRRLIDGSLLNPVPIAPTLRDMTDLTVAVNLSGDSEPGLEQHNKPDASGEENRYKRTISKFVRDMMGRTTVEKALPELGMLEVINQSLDAMQNAIARYKLANYSPDIVINIPKNACHFYEFHRADEIITLGRERAAAALGSHEKHIKTGLK